MWIWVRCVCTLSLVAVVIGGCAYTDVRPIDPSDTVTPGVRYYDVKPLLVLTSGEKGAAWNVVFIPNFNRAYAVRFGAFLAKNDVNIEFSQTGTLHKLGSSMDSTQAIELLKLAAERLLPPPAKADQPRGTPQYSPPTIYEFVFNSQGELVGLRRLPSNIARTVITR